MTDLIATRYGGMDACKSTSIGMFRRSAFSLLELLVVIAIIGVLLSILLPLLAQVRHSAKTVVCAAHLQQLGQAFLLYTGENRGVLPYAGLSDHDTWDTLIAPTLGRTQQATGPATADPSPVLACPEDDRDRPTYAGVPGYSPTAVRSYSMPQALLGFSGELLYGIGVAQHLPDTPVPGFRGIRLTEVRRPAQYLLLVENFTYDASDGTSNNIAGNWVGSWVGSPSGQTLSYTAGANEGLPIALPVHAKKWNYLFCDGHVQVLAPVDTVKRLPGMTEGQALRQPFSENR